MKNKLKSWVLKHRFITLIIGSAFGLYIFNAYLDNNYFYIINISQIDNKQLINSVAFVLLGLPVLILLWFFRTHDVRESIQKTEESTRISILFNAQKLLFKSWVLKHRFITLIIGSAFGLYIFNAYWDNNYFCIINISQIDNKQLINSVAFVLLSLPVLILLWFFRTHDVGESIQKTEESTRASILFNAQKLLFGDKLKDKTVGLILLLQLKHQGYFRHEIDISTRGTDLQKADLQNLDLQEVDLRGAILNHTNLHEADLRSADLRNADLRGANLSRTNLQEADFGNVDLRNADLRGADLRNANLINAKHNNATQFSDDFNPDDYKMTYQY